MWLTALNSKFFLKKEASYVSTNSSALNLARLTLFLDFGLFTQLLK